MSVETSIPADRLLPCDREYAPTVSFNIGLALRAMGVFGKRIPTAGRLSAVAEHFDAVGEGELDGMVIEDLANVFPDAHLPAAHALGFDRMSLGDPIADVDVMHMLFDDVIAGQPCEVIPIVNLVLHFRLIRFRGRTQMAPVLKYSRMNCRSPMAPSWMRRMISRCLLS